MWEAAGGGGRRVHTFRYTQCFLVLGTMMSHVCVLILVSQQKNQGPGYGRERAREPEDLCRKQRAAVESGRHHSGGLRQTEQESMQWSGKLTVQANSQHPYLVKGPVTLGPCYF